MPRNSNRSKKQFNGEKKVFRLSVTHTKDYDLSEILSWIKDFTSTKDVNYREYSRNTLFFFDNLNDAFYFRMHWDAPYREAK